jgi:hypothetical protein
VIEPSGNYSFLYTYDTERRETIFTVYRGIVVGDNRLARLFGTATGDFPITAVGNTFRLTFGNDPATSDPEAVPTYGWVYKNLKIYLERFKE